MKKKAEPEIKEDSTLYNIDDDDNDQLYSLEDPDSDDDEDDLEDEEIKKTYSPMGVLFKIMLTPVEGWKALRRAHFKTDDVASRCFYPLIALAAVSDVMKMFYEAHYSFSDWAVEGLSTFISFFFGYFTILLIGGVILPKKSRDILKTDIGRQFVMMNLSTLTLFWVLIQLLPMIEPVLVFLPLWTVYLIYKGVRIMRVNEDVRNSTIGYLCLLIIGAPILWNWLFTEFLLPGSL